MRCNFISKRLPLNIRGEPESSKPDNLSHKKRGPLEVNGEGLRPTTDILKEMKLNWNWYYFASGNVCLYCLISKVASGL